MSQKNVSMIDISEKPHIKRVATAAGKIILTKKTIGLLREGKIKKGNPLIVAEVAAINAIKMTPQLIPLCHQIPITNIEFTTEIKETFVYVKVTVTTIAQTGVEMEALVGVTAFLNVIWDMTKYLEKDEEGQYPFTKITDIEVIQKKKIGND
ncbi:MAG: cyclic pyranopterin monophosphate synthase MoaC [Candidatus Helarchaeota archaeon]